MALDLLLATAMIITTPRRSPRVACALPVYWTRWKNRMSGDVRRCNFHGMFIKTPHDAPVGYMMDLNLVMPWGEITCTAVPRFVGDCRDGHGMGVELHVMDRGDREMWNQYYRRVLAEHAELTGGPIA